MASFWKCLDAVARRCPRLLPTIGLLVFFSVYFLIGSWTHGRPYFRPEVALDRWVPLAPAWVTLYGFVYLFLFLPLFIVFEPELFRRTAKAYLITMLLTYLGFLLLPTRCPRPETLPGEDFFSWALRINWALDPPYNCFPSLHVGIASIAALASYKVHRGVGLAALAAVCLIALSTLFTKQHYLVDLIGGMATAVLAWWLYLRDFQHERVAEVDRQRAPWRALGVVAIYGVVVAAFFLAYRLTR